MLNLGVFKEGGIRKEKKVLCVWSDELGVARSYVSECTEQGLGNGFGDVCVLFADMPLEEKTSQKCSEIGINVTEM